MKITSVHLFAAPSPTPIELSFRDPSASNRYLAEAISGLDADELLRQYTAAGGGGVGKMYDITLPKRDVVIRIALNPRFEESESYSDLRDHLFRLIASSRTGEIRIQFNNGATAVAEVRGHISKLEAPQFSKEQKAQLTITCADPMLKALTRTVVDVSSLVPTNTIISDPASTAPHGFQFEMGFLATVPIFAITDVGAGKAFSAAFPGGFLVGDKLFYSSERGNKFLYMVRGSTTYPLIDKVGAGSVWPLMFPGGNQYMGVANMKWNAISYVKHYWGV